MRCRFSVVNITHTEAAESAGGSVLLPRRRMKVQISTLIRIANCDCASLYRMRPRRGTGAVRSIETSASEKASAFMSPPKIQIPAMTMAMNTGASASNGEPASPASGRPGWCAGCRIRLRPRKPQKYRIPIANPIA